MGIIGEMENGRYKMLSIEAVYFLDSNCGYAMSRNYNGLFHIDIEKKRAMYISSVQGEPADRIRLYFSAAYAENKIYFSPNSARRIAVYDLNRGILYSLDIPIPWSKVSRFDWKTKMGDSVSFDSKIYIFGSSYPMILKIDPVTDKVEIIDTHRPFKSFFRKGVIVGNRYYSPSNNSPVIMVFDFFSEEIIYYEVAQGRGAWNLCFHEGIFWLPPRMRDSKLIGWKEHLGTVECKDVVSTNNNIDFAYLMIYQNHDDDFVIMPEKADAFIIVDNQNGKTKEFRINDEANDRFYLGFETNDNIYFEQCSNVNGKVKFNRFIQNKRTMTTSKWDLIVENRSELIQGIARAMIDELAYRPNESMGVNLYELQKAVINL